MTGEVVDFYTERLHSGRGFKYPVEVIYDYGESRYVLYEGCNRCYAAMHSGYDYVLGRLESRGWLEIRDTFGMPDIQVEPLKETVYQHPAELPPSNSEFLEQNGK